MTILTSHIGNDTIPPEWGWIMQGVFEYRPGHWRVPLYFKGKKYILYRDHNGSPLDSQRQAIEFKMYLSQVKKKPGFDPSILLKDKPFLFERAVEIWIVNSNISMEYLEHREDYIEKFWMPKFKGMDIREIKEIHLNELRGDLIKKGYSERTIFNILSEFKIFLRFHRRSLPYIPDLPKIRYQDPVIQWIDSDVQDKIIEEMEERDRPIFVFLKYTGARLNEARGLLRKNIFKDQNYFVLETVLDRRGVLRPNTKTRIAKPLPIIPEIEECFKPHEATPFVFSRDGRPYSKSTMFRVWKRASIESHSKHGTPTVPLYRAFRHSFACQRLNDGFSLDAIQHVMGHTDIRTTQKYAKYKTEKLTDVMRGNVARVILGSQGVVND